MEIKKFRELILEESKWDFEMKIEKDKDQGCTLCGSLDDVYALKAIKKSGANTTTLNICKACIKEMNKRLK